MTRSIDRSNRRPVVLSPPRGDDRATRTGPECFRPLKQPETARLTVALRPLKMAVSISSDGLGQPPAEYRRSICDGRIWLFQYRATASRKASGGTSGEDSLGPGRPIPSPRDRAETIRPSPASVSRAGCMPCTQTLRLLPPESAFSPVSCVCARGRFVVPRLRSNYGLVRRILE